MDFICDRNGEEPHFMSAVSLKEIITQYGLVDIRREKNKEIKQFTWIKMTDNRVSAACLDRFYINKTMYSRIEETCISPSLISDHHLISLKMLLTQTVPHCNYWRFCNKLLDNFDFHEKCNFFWSQWTEQKSNYENLLQWWEVEKVQIKIFCQQFSSQAWISIKNKMSRLEEDISILYGSLITRNDMEVQENLLSKKQEFRHVLHEKVKSALVRTRFITINDMDAPTKFFFQFGKKGCL